MTESTDRFADEVITDNDDPFFNGMSFEEAEQHSEMRTAAVTYVLVNGLRDLLLPQVKDRAFEGALQSVLNGLAQEGYPIGDYADDEHNLLRYEEGDGWNEPHHTEFFCSCGQLEFASWTQKDREGSDYPKALSILDPYIAHKREVSGA